ncbi:CheR family methyltransferase [Lysobacter sp. TAB13]|uniref:CheR family methyltransferase n=1 Tax=Lysobacter sp. TAB13 TaxID=3233065 RepID=UPI003F952C7B
MTPEGFQQWLKHTMGLDAASIGPGVVERAVQRRISASERADLTAYWHLLRASQLEQQELIEAVVVPETWFFRDNQAFAALSHHYDPLWAASHPGERLRALSLPCSSGEEPYTVVMALLDAGFPIDRLDVDAVDISERALSKARHGAYGSNSFRGRELGFRDRHFHLEDGAWRLPASIRSRVRFIQGNVLDIAFLPGEALYDAIFCRNLLIYFDAQTQVRTVEILRRLLRPQGLLFVGPSEASLMLAEGFVSAQFPMAFAFRKAPPKPAVDIAAPAPRKTVTAIASARPAPLPRALSAAVRPTPPARPAPPPSPAQAVDESLLDRAQALADNGRFAEAATACEAYLQTHSASARALYLSGLIHGALGRDSAAEDHFRKVLYLEPCHEEALMHLALLLETRGDAAGGRVLRLRAQRCRSAAVGRQESQ